MRDLGQCLPRYGARTGYYEQGMGFSWGGFHPFRINDWKKAVKKIDQKMMNITGLDRIKPIANLNRSVWKDVEKFDKSVGMDFQKGKKWAQAHRKQLQIAAAVVAAAVGGAYALGYLGTSGAASAAGATGATSAAGATTAASTATLAGSAGIVEVGGITAPAIVGTTATAAATGGSVLGTIGTSLGLVSTTVGLLGKIKAAQAPQEPVMDSGAVMPIYGGGGYSGGGGGGILGPANPFGDQPQEMPEPSKTPSWIVPALIVGGIVLISR